MTERKAYRPVQTVGACVIVIVAVLGGVAMVEATDTAVNPSSSTTADALKKKPGKAQGKSNVQPTKRRHASPKGTATVTPMESGKEGNVPASSTRDQDSVGPTAAPMIVPSPSVVDNASPVHRFGPMDREKATLTGQAAEANRAVPVGNGQIPSPSNQAVGMSPTITMAGQGVQQLPSAIMK